MRWQLGFGCISVWVRRNPRRPSGYREQYFGIQISHERFLMLNGSLHRTHGFKVSDDGITYNIIVQKLQASGWTMKLNNPELHKQYVEKR